MPIKDRVKNIVLGSLALFIIYFFIATKRLNNDLYFFPLWSSSIEKDVELIDSDENTNKLSNAKLYPFLIKNKFGYFSEDGKILFSHEITGKVTASSNYWCQYEFDCHEAHIYEPNGKIAGVIKVAGFPYIVDNKIYIFTPGGYGVCEYSVNGKRLWHYAHTAAITAFNCSKKGVVIGYSDGKVVYLDERGNEVFNLYPGGSTYEVISGVALSNDGVFIACISGIEKQRVLLIRIIEKQYKIVKHEYLKGNLYRNVFVSFDKDSSSVIFESSDGIGIINCKNYQLHFLDETGEIIDIGDRLGGNLITILTKNYDSCKLFVIEKPFRKLASTSFNSKDVFLLQDEKKIFLGTVGNISAIEIKKG